MDVEKAFFFFFHFRDGFLRIIQPLSLYNKKLMFILQMVCIMKVEHTSGVILCIVVIPQ